MQHPRHFSNLTRRGVLLSFAIVLLFAAFPAALLGQDDVAEIARKRQRWEQMSEEERSVMRERFEKLRRMSSEERRELHERARNFRDLENGLRKAPPRDLKERIGRHHREWDRKKEVQLYVGEHSKRFGSHMLRKLPQEIRAKFDRASPEERMHLLREYSRRCRSRSGSWTERVIRMSDLPDAEKERVLALPEAAQKKKVLELKRQWMRKMVQERGFPPGVTAEEWERMDSLSDEEFFTRLRALDPMPDYLGGRSFWRRARGGSREGGRRGEGPGHGMGPGRRGDSDRGDESGRRGEWGGGRDGENGRGDRRRGPGDPPRKAPPPAAGESGGKRHGAI